MPSTPLHELPEADIMAQLETKLATLPTQLGFADVTLKPFYQPQYGYVSLRCEGGTLEQQRQLITRLATPPSGLPKLRHKKPAFSYADSSAPQINFNGVQDAFNVLQCLDLAARRGILPSACDVGRG